MSNDQNLDPKLQQVLKQIGNFGFKFYGFDENSMPLVSGPNGQVVPINVAISFVNQQIQNKNNSSGNLESSIVESSDSSSNIETANERQIETKLETPKDSTQAQNTQTPTSVQTKAPQVKLSEPKKKPYGEGFDPRSFDPADITSILKFIEKNHKTNPKSSNRWIAEQFKKFIADYTKKP